MKAQNSTGCVFASSHFPSLAPAGSRAVGKNRLWSRRKHAVTEQPRTHKQTQTVHRLLLAASSWELPIATWTKTESLTTQSALLVSDLYRTLETLARLKALCERLCGSMFVCKNRNIYNKIKICHNVLKPTQRLQTSWKSETLFISAADTTGCTCLKNEIK